MSSRDGFKSTHWDAGRDLRERAAASNELKISDEEAAVWAMMLAGSMPKTEVPSGLLGPVTIRVSPTARGPRE